MISPLVSGLSRRLAVGLCAAGMCLVTNVLEQSIGVYCVAMLGGVLRFVLYRRSDFEVISERCRSSSAEYSDA